MNADPRFNIVPLKPTMNADPRFNVVPHKPTEYVKRPTLVRFTRGSGWSAAIVRWFTWSRYAHVGYLLPDDTMLDATPDYGVSIRQWTREMDDDTTEYYVLDVPPECLASAIMWGATQVGKPYDWWGIFGFISHRDWHTDDAWFCSEYLVESTVKGGIPMLSFEAMAVGRITPCMARLSLLLMPYEFDLKTGGGG